MGIFHSIPIELVIIIELLLISFLIYQIRSIVKLYRAQDKALPFEEKITTTFMKRFKQPFASIITKELIMYYYLFKKVDRIPLRNGSHYSYHKNSSYKIFLAAILLTAVIEGIGVFFLLHHLVPIISWIHTILVVYCLLYFISDYKAVLAKPITVTSQKLYLHLGIRSNEVILIENIQYAAKATKSMEEHKKDKSVFNMLLIDMEGHNVEIMLKEPIIKKTFFGKERPIYSIHIKVDSPSEFIQEVNSRQLQVCS